MIAMFKGLNGRIELYDNRLVIKRKGFYAKIMYGFTQGDKTIYLNQISGIDFKKAGFRQGYIQFTVPGGNENTAGLAEARTDENTVVFRFWHRNKAKAIREQTIQTHLSKLFLCQKEQ